MLQKVRAYIKNEQLLQQGEIIVAGVSGGADSVCLLLILKELQEEYALQLHVVHVNHMLRAEAADADEAYVRQLCERMEIPCTVYRYPVEKLARENKCSTEEMGRMLRYEAFSEKLTELGGHTAAVAHHMDDHAETMLHHLFRGSSLRGLCGMYPKRRQEQFSVIRPLLCVERKEIIQYLQQRGVEWQEDETNAQDCYTRNKIRRHVLSYVQEEISPGVIGNLCRTAGQLQQIEAYLQKQAEAVLKQARITETEATGKEIELSVEQLRPVEPLLQTYVVRSCLEELHSSLRDVAKGHIESVCALVQGGVGKTVHLPAGLVARRTYETILIEKDCGKRNVSLEEKCETQKETGKPVWQEISAPGEYLIEEMGTRFVFTKKTYKITEKIPNSTYTKWMDYDKIDWPLIIRTRQKGDYLVVTKDGGRKKLNDYLIDCKVPKEKRDSLLVLACKSHVLWVPGLRISEACKVTETTKTVVVIERKDTNDE